MGPLEFHNPCKEISEMDIWDHANVFTHVEIKQVPQTFNPEQDSKDVNRLHDEFTQHSENKGIVLFGYGQYAFDDTRAELSTSFNDDEKWYPIHLKNLDRHYTIEFKLDASDKIRKAIGFSSDLCKGNKIRDVMDLMPPTAPSAPSTPSWWNVQWTEGAITRRKNNKLETIEYDLTSTSRNVKLTMWFNVGHSEDAYTAIRNLLHPLTRSGRHIKYDRVLVELDVARGIAFKKNGVFWFPPDADNLRLIDDANCRDMEVGSRMAMKDIADSQRGGKTKELILADMPITSLTRNPLLFEPFSKGFPEGPDGAKNQNDISPVVNKMYYHDFLTVIRNTWMVYAINSVVAQTTGDQEMVILIGGQHGATNHPKNRYDKISKYSMREMLKSEKVSLPFIFTGTGQNKKIKFNLDPELLEVGEAQTKYGSAAMSEYDNWMNDEYEYGYDDDADLYDEDEDEDYFDDDADYDYYYDLLNYILRLFQ